MYPDQTIVMLHCWPYIEESGYLGQGEVKEIAAQLLHNNAVEIYGIGQLYP